MGLTLRAGRCYSLRRAPAPRSPRAGAPVKQHLLIGLMILPLAAFTLVGCRTHPYEPSPQPVPANSFMQAWRADLRLKDDAVKAIHVRENFVIVYTTNNKGYWLNTTG